MPINKESLNRRLYKVLSRYNPKPLDYNGEVTPVEDEADVFKLNFTKDGEDYGIVYVTIDDTNTLTVWYGDDVMDSPSSPTPGLDYNDSFTGFTTFLKNWAMNNQLGFNRQDRERLGSEMARRKHMKEKEKIAEGYYPMGKKASYSDNVPNVKIILQHSKVMQEGEQRFRHIEKIFVENANGERFLVPTTKPGLARVFARHIAEGGTPYDDRAGHIQSLVEEYNKMAGFVRATKNGQFNESAQQLVQEGINHYLSLRESLGKLTGHRGYTAYFESWTPPLMEDETDTNTINELFVQETLDPRIESVMPILSRIHKHVAEMKEVGALSEWADSLLEDDLAEDEGIKSNNPVGIPEEEVEEGFVGNMINKAKGMFTKPGQPAAAPAPAAPAAPVAAQAAPGAVKKGGTMDMTKKVMPAAKPVAKPATAAPAAAPAPAQSDYSPQELAQINKDVAAMDPATLAQVAARTDLDPTVTAAVKAEVAKRKGVAEGLGDIAKKVGSALKKAGGKALDTLGHGSDEDLLKDLKKRAGVRNSENGKPSMAQSDVEKVGEDLDANQKRVGQLGPTEKVKNNNIGKLVGANENFIAMAPQAVAEGQEDLDAILRIIKK